VALGATAWRALRAGERPRAGRLPRAVLVAGIAWIALCVASVAWSDDLAYSIVELRRELAYGLGAFVAFHALARVPRDTHLAVGALVAGALALGLLEWAGALFPGLPEAFKYRAALGYFSTEVVIAAPLLAVVAWPRPEGLGAGRATIVALAAGLVAGGLASENRMLWLALAVGTLAGFAVFRRVAPPEARSAGAGPVFLLVVAVAALLVAASWEYKAWRYYPQAAGAMQSLSLDERPLIWKSAIAPIAERPWTGHGFGREIAGDAIERGLARGGSPNRFRHAHNVFLDVALQLGFPGLAVFVALFAALVAAFLRAAGRPGGAAVGIAGVAMLAAFLTKNLTDDFFHRPNSLVFWAVTGMLLGLAAPREP